MLKTISLLHDRVDDGPRMLSRRRFVQTVVTLPLIASSVSRIPWQQDLQSESKNHPPGNSTVPINARVIVATRQLKRAPAIVPPDKQFMASLPQLMELAQLPGLGIGIVHGEQLIWQHYAGIANARTKTPIIPSSIFPAASMGKQVFAYAVLRLVDEDRLDLDRPLKDYLSEGAPSGEMAARITARHVLTHSSGLPNWREDKQPLVPTFEPGTKFRYSGEGFYYLQRCVEKISGIGCEQFMQDRMFKPLRMNSSTYLWQADAGERLVSSHRGDEPFDNNRGFAEQLFQLIQKSGVPLAEWNHNRIVEQMAKTVSPPRKLEPNDISPNVAFSLLTTVTDYCSFLTRITAPRGDAFDLKPETRASMMEAYSHLNGALSWGLGWGIEDEGKQRYLWQWGDNGGCKNIVIVHPESRSGLVVFTNSGSGMRVAEQVAKAATGIEHALFRWL